MFAARRQRVADRSLTVPASTQAGARSGPAREEDDVAFPRILLVVPLLVAGMYLPNAIATPPKPAAGVLGMTHEGFSSKEVSVGCGKTLTMVNDSHWVHIIGPGRDAILSAERGVPVDG